MALFQIRAVSVAGKTGSTWMTNSGGTSDADILSIISSGSCSSSDHMLFSGPPNSGQLRFNGKFYLDGSASPTEINSLPAGFNLSDATVEVYSGLLEGDELYLQFSALQESANLTGTTCVRKSFAYPTTLPAPFLLYSSGFGIRKAQASSSYRFAGLKITGSYVTVSGSFTIPTAQPVTVGDTITIDATSGLDDVTSVNILYEDSLGATQEVEILAASFVTQSATQITFLLPVAFNGLTVTGSVYLLSTAFSGYVFVAPLSILVADASGIYRIVPGKTDDTIYTGTSNNTEEVAIPRPLIKTGFIGG